ncbi:MAG: tyrosine-type recombinase/integrase [Limisphaerales bacterium]
MKEHQLKADQSIDKPLFNRVGENLYRLESSGVYYALFKRGGKQIRKSLKTTDPALARRRLAEHRQRVDRLNQTKGASKITFSELAERWLATMQIRLKESSISRIQVCLKGLAPYFRGLPVRNVTHRHCENWMLERGKAISASSYKHERRVLIAILDYAAREGMILDNPARRAVPTRKISKAKLTIPTREQFRILVETIRQADRRAQTGANLVELLGYSGMRLGEAVNLAWGDIDWDRGTFTVTGGERGTKNHEVRVVPLFPAMRELSERIRGDRQPEALERIIPFTGPNGAATAIKHACKRAGLPHFLHHSMRHYFCSSAIEAGIDFKVIAGWLGHKDGGFLVAKTYGHLRDAHSFEMVKRMTFSALDVPPANVVPLPQATTA